MTDVELTDEERALLQAAEPPSEDADAPKKRATRKAKVLEEPAEASEQDAEPVVPELGVVEQDLDVIQGDIDSDVQDLEKVLAPEHGHPLAPPAQCDYGDPWGLLPLQMRHDSAGKRAF